MNIGIFTDTYYPEINGVANSAYQLKIELDKHGNALGDVFVCASTSEMQGLTYAETLAAGKPLLVHQDECLRDLLKLGTNGYAFECADEFRQYYFSLFHLEHYLEMDRAARESARSYSSERFWRKHRTYLSKFDTA